MVESVVLKKDKKTGIFTSGRIVIRTVRRSSITPDFKPVGVNKIDKPVIFSKDPELIRLGMDGIKRGDFIVARGNFCSQDKERPFVCKECGSISIDDLATASYIDPVYVRKIKDAFIDKETGEIDEKASEDELFSSINISNYSILIGMVCQEPEGLNIGYSDSGRELYRYKFEIAVNRVRLIETDPEDKNADFIWVSTYGEVAKKCSENLRKGSIVLVYGAVHSREKEDMFHKTCDHCGEEIFQKGTSYEIIPYDVLFLENCKDENFRQIGDNISDETGYMNEAYVLGMVRDIEFAAKKNGDVEANMAIETKKRTSVTDEYKLRARDEYDLPIISTVNKDVMIKGFNDAEKGDVVFVKGTVIAERKKKVLQCPFCGYNGRLNKVSFPVTKIDPVRIVPFFRAADAAENSPTENKAMKIIRGSYEITNQVLVIGTVCEEPSEEMYYHDPTSVDTLRDRFEFKIRTSRTRHALERDENKKTNEIRVVTFGKWAYEAYNTIHKNSALMINGAITTKAKKEMHVIRCGECGRKLVGKGSETYLLPYRIEYLKDCDIPQTEDYETVNYAEGEYDEGYEP